jgi:ribosomal protein S18 acetylase RimI-like enzyme
MHPPHADHPAAAVRIATTADHGAVRRVLRAAYAQYLDVLGPELHAGYLADLCDLNQRLVGGELLVATLGGAIVGTATFHPDPLVGHFAWPTGWTSIRAVGGEPGCRGHGIAEQLLRACIARAVGLGATAVGLHTAHFMTSAVALYERLGFRRTPELDVDAAELVEADGRTAPLAIAYRLPLR